MVVYLSLQLFSLQDIRFISSELQPKVQGFNELE